MAELLVIGLAGFLASFVDGALGMGFGPTSSTILLSTGLSPAAISTTVNLAKVATGLAAAVSHWRFENIDHRLVLRLAIPGALGAGVGVTILASFDGDDLKPILSALLLVIGLRILVRFASPVQASTADRWRDDVNLRGTEAAAVAGGITNGLVGAWGPVVTPFLLHRGLPPRYAIGSVNTAEVAVAVVASGSLLASIGGVIASPVSAWLVRFLPARALGLGVAALLLLTNTRELAGRADLGATRWLAYGTIVLAIALGAWWPQLRRQRVRTAATQ